MWTALAVLWASKEKLGQHTFSVADSFHCLPLLQDELWRDAYPEGPSGASQCWLMWHRLVLCGCLGCWRKNRCRELEYTHKKCLTLCYSQTCRYKLYLKGRLAAEHLLLRAVAILCDSISLQILYLNPFHASSQVCRWSQLGHQFQDM